MPFHFAHSALNLLKMMIINPWLSHLQRRWRGCRVPHRSACLGLWITTAVYSFSCPWFVALVVIFVPLLKNESAALRARPALFPSSSLLPGQFPPDTQKTAFWPSASHTVMKVGCCFSAFLPTLASNINWHHLLNGIAGVCKLLLQLSLIIELDEWNWHNWPPAERKQNRREGD